MSDNQPNLSLADLANAKSILEVATQRGAFRANELTAVGSLYDKLAAFLSAATPAATAETEATAATTQPTE